VFTGSDLGGPAQLAAGLVLLGMVLVATTRRGQRGLAVAPVVPGIRGRSGGSGVSGPAAVPLLSWTGPPEGRGGGDDDGVASAGPPHPNAVTGLGLATGRGRRSAGPNSPATRAGFTLRRR
jgi:hypothetical protein